MYNQCSTVALYDTLGMDATCFIVDQSELSSVACSPDIVERII